MKKSFFTILLLALFASLGISQDHTITLQGIAFSPSVLTINVGETVLFSNVGGNHNVDGSQQSYPDNPESFSSGAPANAPWQFMHTFNTPGVYNYDCDVHFNFGMTGMITVVGGAGDVVITEISYNNPGNDTLEYVELYNNSGQTLELQDWVLSNAVDFTFPQHTLAAGEYVLVANNASAFDNAFGFVPFQYSGSLNNTGETITLTDNNGALVDEVTYADTDPWPSAADGSGPSLVLCDFTSDNSDPANWGAAVTPTGVFSGGIEVLANPGAESECQDGPVISFFNTGFNVLENAGSVFITVVMTNGDANTTTVDLEMDLGSTADNGDDFVLSLPFTVTFDAGVPNDTQTVVVNLVDDTAIEATEVLVLNLINPTNGGNIAPNGSQFFLTILDDDAPISNSLVITGVFDTQVESGGTWAKGIELQALEDIDNLSVFGVGSANNGGGSGGVETVLPGISVSAGDCIYVTNDSTLFHNFFGIPPTIIGDASNINGDDAIELFENNIVIDVFGDILVDGTGQPWEYLDGWAYRKDGTGPDGSSFNLDNWLFSGINAFDLVTSNAAAPVPFPTCGYLSTAPTTAVANNDNATVPFETATTINILGNDVTPNPLTTLNVTSGPTNGTVTVNGLDNITYTPANDYCGPDAFTYEICDAAGCDEATVNITVECPVVYTPMDNADVTMVDASGMPTSMGAAVELTGIVHGIDLQGVNAGGMPLPAIQFTLIDATGGISVFSSDDLGYTVQEGDELTLQGQIGQFNCVTQLTPVNLTLNSSGNPLVDPEITAFLNESFESELIQINNLTFVDPGQWAPAGTGFTVKVTNGASEFDMRIDNDNELFNMPIPSEPFHARGIGGQFNNQGNCLVGYQFLPRYAADIIPLNSAKENLLSQKIAFYPNPVGERLFLETTLNIDAVSVSNLLGQRLFFMENPGNSLDVSDLQAGIYLVTFQVEEASWTAKFIK